MSFINLLEIKYITSFADKKFVKKMILRYDRNVAGMV